MSRVKLKRFKVKKPPPEALAQYVRDYPGRELHYRPQALPSLAPAALFGDARPLIFDLGCGRGGFTVAQAQAHPDRGVVGFDWHWKSIWDAVNRARAAGVDNVRFARGDFRRVLPLVPAGVAETVYLLFPPPVMKRSKRRQDALVAPLVAEIARVLAAGGWFHFVTDSAPYFEAKRALIAASGLFKSVTVSRGFEGGLTRFQRFWEGFEIESKRLSCRTLAEG
jgi:tRNA (guanine-N7-)-methyltransferase